MAKNEAVFLNVNCIKAHQRFYARYDYAFDNVWVLSYGLTELPQESGTSYSSNGGRGVMSGAFRTGPQYRCPYCGNREFVRCGQCKNLTCYDGSGMFTCDHCGNTGEVNGTIESIEGDLKHSQ